MPDQFEVEEALAAVLADALYPDGTAAPSALGARCLIYRGWPSPAALDADLTEGGLHVTVQAVPGTARNTTRYPAEWSAEQAAAPLRASVSGDVASFSGAVMPGVLAGLLADGVSVVHRAAPGDTPELVAASLAARLRRTRPVFLRGASVHVPGVGRLLARAVMDGAATRELRRQEARFRAVAWCPTPALRDDAAALLDLALAELPRLDVGGAPCPLRYAGTASSDEGQSAAVYRRDLLYDVEYPTTVTRSQPAMLFGTAGATGAAVTV